MNTAKYSAPLGCETSVANASSLVAKKIASSVPSVIYFFSNSFAAITENPHCGINPVAEPNKGPSPPLNFPFADERLVFRSNNSIII
jgi:hypothetical protein